MKVIILNRKRIGVTLVIIGLMLVLFVAGKTFEEKLKITTLMQNGIDSLKQYDVLKGSFKYKLPENWSTSQKNFGGGEILYHNDFNSSDEKIHGFVEVWKLRESLKSFLDSSKSSAFKPESYKNYSLVPKKINNHSGYLLTYDMNTSSGKYYKSYEYFVDNKDNFFRISFYVMEDNFKENMPAIFEAIASTYESK